MLKASRRLFRPAPWQNDTLLEIGTRDIFTEEHDLCREQFRRFWRSVDRSRVTSWEQQECGFKGLAYYKINSNLKPLPGIRRSCFLARSWSSG